MNKYNFKSITDTSLRVFQNSGLCMLYDAAVFNLLNADLVVFQDSYLLDTFANKGFMVATLQVKTSKVLLYVILTHLNDGYDGCESARRVQYKQLATIRKYIARNFSPHIPFIIMGDLNVDFRTNTYAPLNDMLKTLHIDLENSIPTYVGHTVDCCRDQRCRNHARVYDYIIINDHASKTATHVWTECERGSFLSDHFLISANISLRPAGRDITE